ncbi:MAG: DNA primase regulatory subunit PriL, partial [Thermoplasmata archaeon]|nr:DNA primase regulatory subunit PriL [Thermoplasmata archaeon]
MAVHDDLVRYNKYPFSQGAGEYIREMGIDISSLLEDRAYEAARIDGGERAGHAVRDGHLPPPQPGGEVELLNGILSYPVARMIVSCTGDGYVIKRYALAEAVRAREQLLEEDVEFLMEMAGELGLEAGSERGEFTLHFTDYLRFTVQMRSKEAKLVNQ